MNEGSSQKYYWVPLPDNGLKIFGYTFLMYPIDPDYTKYKTSREQVHSANTKNHR